MAIVIYLFLGGTGAGTCLVAACLGISALRLAFREAQASCKNAPAAVSCANAACRPAFSAAAYPGCCVTPETNDISHPAAERARRTERKLLSESLHAARKTLTANFMAAAFCLAAGACFLLVDLGRPDRALSLITRPTLSYVTVGAWALGICLCLALLLAFSWKRHATLPPVLGFALHAIAIVVSAVVMVYTGLLLASITATPLWNSPWLAPLFFLSAASCGCAVVLLCARALRLYRAHPRVMQAVLLADGCIIALEAVATAALVLDAAGPAGPAALAAHTAAALPPSGLTPYEQAQLMGALCLVSGPQAPWFWGGYVLCGIAAPLTCDIAARLSPRLEPTLSPVCAISVLIGGVAVRYCIVVAGMQAASLL